MKVALVHELLTMRGGAERTLRVFAEMFPDAPIYTLLYDKNAMGDWIDPARVRPSTLQRWAGVSANHHLYLKHFPAAAEAWDFSPYDLVISSSSAFAHGILTNGNPKHLCYVHSPARYLWDRTHDVLDRAGKGALGPLKRAYLHRTFHRLRVWDAESAPRPDRLLAASAEVQRRIELYWRRESTVLHPPLDDAWLDGPVPKTGMPATADRYFLVVSTLAAYKRVELAVEACRQADVRLKIAGDGPARAALERLAGPKTEFLGFQTESQLRALYAGATATLFPGEEDFGLVPLESMACGTPVIAYRAGGALETVTKETGTFFDAPAPQALAETIRTFDACKYAADACRAQATGFGRKRFEEAVRGEMDALMATA